MPRRPPKKPDPALDLSAHLLALADLPTPLDPATLFPRAAPVELEVGSGKGLFLSSASAGTLLSRNVKSAAYNVTATDYLVVNYQMTLS